MPDKDLRRQVLGSTKTISRKARSRVASGASSKAASAANSRAESRNASRTVSRSASDDEEGNLSDDTNWSTNSIDDILSSEDIDAPPDVWKAHLGDRMAEIIDRKRSSTEGRADALAAYAYQLKAHYAAEDVERKLGELIPAIIKSVRSGSERETVMALKAIELTVITCPSDRIYDAVVRPVKAIISDSESLICKVAAIHALGTATFYGGASLEETQDTMDYFLEIVESDGHSIDAGDQATPVVAALTEWGFLATQMDDLEDSTEPAMEAFVDQLDSADVSVQIAAGENIALLYEKSCTEIEEDEEPSSEDEADDPHAAPGSTRMIKRYTVYRREDQLKHKLSALASLRPESGRVSKKDRSRMRSNFSDILNSVEHPTRGPHYSTAIDLDNRIYGSRMFVKISQYGEMKIDKWWKLFRLNALRRSLQGGFATHYEKNEVVFDSLPIMIQRRKPKDRK